MDEDALIARYFAPLARAPGAAGLRDDAAEIAPLPEGRVLALTTDALVEGVHFLERDPLETVARKLVRVNVSDLLAKGARPREAALTLAWPTERDPSALEGFAAAMGEELAAWGIDLIGGDTVRQPGPLMVSLTLIGVSCGPRLVRRSGAAPGDRLWITGEIGWGHIGLAAARALPEGGGAETPESSLAASKYRAPQLPPLSAANLLARYATAAMDVSDGLLADLAKLLRASGVSAQLEADRVPLARKAASFAGAAAQLTGGDDYQILLTAPADISESLGKAAARIGLGITDIGSIDRGQGLSVSWHGTRVTLPKTLGFSH
ncbi:MAG: thiamine-phosphate kinase [Pseudomonadota bacterium]